MAKKKGCLLSASASDAVNDSDDDHESNNKEEIEPISFTGKKSSKKTGSLFSAVLLKEDGEEAGSSSESPSVSKSGYGVAEEADVVIAFTGKNKSYSSQKKGSSAFATFGDDVTTEMEQEGAYAVTNNAEVDVSVPEEKVSVVKEDKNEGIAESAAAKKKKKKKEKEKEKKAAAATAEVKEEVKTETNSKGADNKLLKHIREMQEALARRKEALERKKREEEERLRKEEEEQFKQEELARQAEEARLRKKEKETEKLRQKKEAGQRLSAKQEVKKYRNHQFLANAGGKLPASDNDAPTKCPIYTRKAKPNRQTCGMKVQTLEDTETKQAAVVDGESVELEKVDKFCRMDVDEKAEVADEIKEIVATEEEDEEDWDAKSWDDTNLGLPVKRPFEDDEADSVTQSLVEREVKQAAQSVRDIVAPSLGVKPAAAVKESEAAGKKRSKEAEVQKDKPSSDIQTRKSEGNLRSPICCIMGHVDSGKTKLLDCIRGTNVQEGEAGGITQQIGATYFPAENIRERTKELKADVKLNVPGLLVIDTPGHKSFANLRSRGSGLCDIAVLVVDIMHGLEQQTVESLNLLKMRNTGFIVALNKVDRLFQWKMCPNAPFRKAMKEQTEDVQNEFNMRLIQFKEQGLNTELYYKNKDLGETFNIVPTSAISGEGIPDLLWVLVQ